MKVIMLLFMIINILGFNIPFTKPENNKVILHLERFNERYNLLHIGISFKNEKKVIRFDFRPNNYGKSYITSDRERLDASLLFPEIMGINSNIENVATLGIYENPIIFDTNNIDKKNIFWGYTNKTHEEILTFERKYLINKKYKVGLYDCRHFVNDYTLWCLNKPTPIWKLNRLWNLYS